MNKAIIFEKMNTITSQKEKQKVRFLNLSGLPNNRNFEIKLKSTPQFNT